MSGNRRKLFSSSTPSGWVIFNSGFRLSQGLRVACFIHRILHLSRWLRKDVPHVEPHWCWEINRSNTSVIFSLRAWLHPRPSSDFDPTAQLFAQKAAEALTPRKFARLSRTSYVCSAWFEMQVNLYLNDAYGDCECHLSGSSSCLLDRYMS